MWMVKITYYIIINFTIKINYEKFNYWNVIGYCWRLSIFIKHDNSWIISALLIGGGSGIFFWKDHKNNDKEK